MRTYEEFKEALVQNIEERFGDKVTATVHMVTKNKYEEEKITVRFREQKAAPSFSLELLYHDYEKRGDISALADRIVAEAVAAPDDLSIPMLTKEEARENLVYQLISKENNGKLLEECPFKVVDGTDLVMILRWKCGNGGSFIVKHGIADAIGVSETDLFEMADDNLNREGYSLRSMADVLKEMMGCMDMEIPEADPALYVLTNTDSTYGAAVLMGTYTMRKIREQFGCGFFVLPSSVHELILIPDRGGILAEDLAAMVRDVNSTEVAPGDVLSDHVYHYEVYEGFQKVI